MTLPETSVRLRLAVGETRILQLVDTPAGVALLSAGSDDRLQLYMVESEVVTTCTADFHRPTTSPHAMHGGEHEPCPTFTSAWVDGDLRIVYSAGYRRLRAYSTAAKRDVWESYIEVGEITSLASVAPTSGEPLVVAACGNILLSISPRDGTASPIGKVSSLVDTTDYPNSITAELLLSKRRVSARVTSMALTDCGDCRLLITHTTDGKVNIRQTDDSAGGLELPGAYTIIAAPTTSSNANALVLITYSAPGNLIGWTRDGTILFKAATPDVKLMTVGSHSSSGPLVIHTCDTNHEVRRWEWNNDNQRLLHTETYRGASINAMSFMDTARGEPRLAISEERAGVRLHDAQTLRPVSTRSLYFHRGRVDVVALVGGSIEEPESYPGFSHSGPVLLTLANDILTLLDLSTYAERRLDRHQFDRVSAANLSNGVLSVGDRAHVYAVNVPDAAEWSRSTLSEQDKSERTVAVFNTDRAHSGGGGGGGGAIFRRSRRSIRISRRHYSIYEEGGQLVEGYPRPLPLDDSRVSIDTATAAVLNPSAQTPGVEIIVLLASGSVHGVNVISGETRLITRFFALGRPDQSMSIVAGTSGQHLIIRKGETAEVWDLIANRLQSRTPLPQAAERSPIAGLLTPSGTLRIFYPTAAGSIRHIVAGGDGMIGATLATHSGQVTTLRVERYEQSTFRSDDVSYTVVSSGNDGCVVIRGLDSEGNLATAPDPVPREPRGRDGYDLVWGPDPTALPEPRLTSRISVDEAVESDAIGRSVITAHLAGAVAQLSRSSPTRTAVVLLDGPWGSGKSFVISQLIRMVSAAKSTSDLDDLRPLEDPVVVRYNAWRETRVGPTWWSMGSALNRAVRGERALLSRSLMTISSTLARLIEAPAWLATLILVFAVLVADALKVPLLKDLPEVIASLTTIGAVALVFFQVMFWSAPAFGKLGVRSSDEGFDAAAREIRRIRFWAPTRGRYQFWSDYSLSVLLFVSVHLVAYLPNVHPPALIRPGPVALLVWAVGLSLLVLLIIVVLRVNRSMSISVRNNPTSRGFADEPLLGVEVVDLPLWLRTAIMQKIIPTLAVLLLVVLVLLRPERLSASALIVFAILETFFVASGAYLVLSRMAGRRRARAFKRPLLLVVDDLDRCSSDRVVEVLEMVHTLVKADLKQDRLQRAADPYKSLSPLVTIIVADSRWIKSAWRSRFADYQSGGLSDRDPASEFVQKVFDHVVLIPGMSSEQITRYIGSVTNQGWKVGGEPEKAAEREDYSLGLPYGGTLRRIVDERDVNRAYDEGLDEEVAALPTINRWRFAAVRAVLSSMEPLSDTRAEHILLQYSGLIGPNPRLVKKIAGALGMLLALRDHLGHSADRDTLVRAAIVWIRLPRVVEALVHGESLPVLNEVERKLMIQLLGSRSPSELAVCFGASVEDSADWLAVD